MTGGSLSDAMRLTRKFTLRRAMEVAVDCARGLAYLHAKKNGAIIHRWGLLHACNVPLSKIYFRVWHEQTPRHRK